PASSILFRAGVAWPRRRRSEACADPSGRRRAEDARRARSPLPRRRQCRAPRCAEAGRAALPSLRARLSDRRRARRSSRRHSKLDTETRSSRLGLERPAEQLGAFAHAGEPVAAAAAVRGRLAEVLDTEPRGRLLVGELQLDALGASVLAHVGERLLRRPEDGQPGIRVELVTLADDLDGRRYAGVALELRDERSEPFRPRQLLVAERCNRAARLVDSVAREAMRALERLDEVSVVMRGGAQARSFELEREPRERVREHIVHLTREALALAEHRGVSLSLSIRLELADEALRTLLSLREPSGEPGDDEERDDAEHLQRRIEDALALAGDLSGRQRDDCERDERDPRRAADAQGCCGDGDEGSEERRPLRLHRGEGGRAENEHRKGRHL